MKWGGANTCSRHRGVRDRAHARSCRVRGRCSATWYGGLRGGHWAHTPRTTSASKRAPLRQQETRSVNTGPEDPVKSLCPSVSHACCHHVNRSGRPRGCPIPQTPPPRCGRKPGPSAQHQGHHPTHTSHPRTSPRCEVRATLARHAVLFCL